MSQVDSRSPVHPPIGLVERFDQVLRRGPPVLLQLLLEAAGADFAAAVALDVRVEVGGGVLEVGAAVHFRARSRAAGRHEHSHAAPAGENRYVLHGHFGKKGLLDGGQPQTTCLKRLLALRFAKPDERGSSRCFRSSR